ncbi:MAG: glycosyltransferase [Firmicutes bacterium]|nr:glycosyltransferase [Bacillota bacterium]
MKKIKIENIIVLGMYPYPWQYQEISDTVRLMTNAFENIKKIFLNPSIGFHRAKADNCSFRMNWECNDYGDVLVCTPPLEIIPSSFGLGKLKNYWILKTLDKLIYSILGSQWRQDTILYVSSGGISQSYKVIKALQPRWIIFDVLDDNIGFPGVSQKDKHILSNQFSYILNRSSLVVTVSQYLSEQLEKDYSIKTRCLPNGIDMQMFAYCNDYNEVLDELRGIEKPLFGFIGALTSWIDYELLWKIAEYLEKGTLVLVGPIIESAVPQEWIEKLSRHPKVLFTGAKPYKQVPHFLYQFDVLLMPRNYQPHSLASDPLKLYEYMATGKPIVSTALPSVMRFRDYFFVAETHQEFLIALGRAQYDWSEEKSNQLKDLVKEFSWKNRSKKMLELFYEKMSDLY